LSFRRGFTAWVCLFIIASIGLSALDYIAFMVRQRRGETLSYVNVREYLPVSDGYGTYKYEFVGRIDVSCVAALLPHQSMTPCWWVQLNSEHYE
jgi:hypothetical protein